MVDANKIGSDIANELVESTFESGVILYPGSFKPPHKGHFAAAEWLATKPFATEVIVIIGKGKRGGYDEFISKKIWDIYLKYKPNPQIKIKIADNPSPVKDVSTYIKNTDKPVYLALGESEGDGRFDFTSKYGNAHILKVPNQFGRISGTDVRSNITDKDFLYNSLPDFLPINAKRQIHKTLVPTLTESLTYNSVVDDFVDFVCELLEIDEKPQVQILDKPIAGEQPSFGGYQPHDKSIMVCFGSRHIIDALRTLAHEMVHYKQDVGGELTNEDGNTGSNIENEANSVAGIIMREYGKLHPELF
jgi:hypothetical protein